MSFDLGVSVATALVIVPNRDEAEETPLSWRDRAAKQGIVHLQSLQHGWGTEPNSDLG